MGSGGNEISAGVGLSLLLQESSEITAPFGGFPGEDFVGGRQILSRFLSGDQAIGLAFMQRDGNGRARNSEFDSAHALTAFH